MHSFEINPEHLMTEVYSYPFPEVRSVIDGLSLPARFMLNTISGEEASSMLASYGFEPELPLPERRDGSLDLDELHVPVLDRLRRIHAESMVGIDSFAMAYPTPGSSSALYTIMAEGRATGDITSVGVLDGDYEGYTAYAESLRIPVKKYQELPSSDPEPGEVWFLSNPSAVNGNWISEDAWSSFVSAGHEIVYDAAYVGLTAPHTVDVSAPNIRAVLTSPSKLFGVFRYRNTGVAYSRKPVAALYGTKWFKDVPALLDTLALYERFHGTLPEAYRPAQEMLCQKLGELAGGDVSPSDVLLLAQATSVNERFEAFRRGPGYRFGLTKLFEDFEGSQS